MDHNYLLRRDHTEAVVLEKVLELLLAFVTVDSIYFSPHLGKGPNHGVLLIVLGEENPQSWDEAYQHCRKLFGGYPQFSFRMYDHGWIADELKDGNPFFVAHCNREHLLYSTPRSAEIALIDALRPKRFLKKARNRFRVDDETVFAVGIDLRYYIKSDNLPQAAYTLHQAMRWLYITASRFLTGEWFVENDLGVQQQHIGAFSASLGKVFDTTIAEEEALLELLHAACNAVQSKTAVPAVTVGQLQVIEAKRDAMRNEVHQLFETCMERCRYQFAQKKAPLVALDETDPLQWITALITDTVATSALYCLGERTLEQKAVHFVTVEGTEDIKYTHYYLLLLVNDYVADVPGNIADKVRTKGNGRYTVTVLMHGKKSLGTRESDQRYFFYQAMEQGRLLFQETVRPPYLSFATPPARDMERARMYVAQRNRTVDFFMEAECLDVGDAAMMKVYMLHLIVEQTCLGLIRLFLGYTPNHFSLPFLLELCTYFTPLTAELFPRMTDKDKELFKLLSVSHNELRYGLVGNVAHHDYEVLRNKCMAFVEKAREIKI